jgi:hypothetical protein
MRQRRTVCPFEMGACARRADMRLERFRRKGSKVMKMWQPKVDGSMCVATGSHNLNYEVITFLRPREAIQATSDRQNLDSSAYRESAARNDIAPSYSW